MKLPLLQNVTFFLASICAVLENWVKIAFSHKKKWNGFLGISARCTFGQGVHRHTCTSWSCWVSASAQTVQPRRRWTDQVYIDLRESPGKTLDYGCLRTCLPALSTCQNWPVKTHFKNSFSYVILRPEDNDICNISNKKFKSQQQLIKLIQMKQNIKAMQNGYLKRQTERHS